MFQRFGQNVAKRPGPAGSSLPAVSKLKPFPNVLAPPDPLDGLFGDVSTGSVTGLLPEDGGGGLNGCVPGGSAGPPGPKPLMSIKFNGLLTTIA